MIGNGKKLKMNNLVGEERREMKLEDKTCSCDDGHEKRIVCDTRNLGGVNRDGINVT